MNRRAFTLLEVLVEVTLSAGLVATGGAWLLGLQRSAEATRARGASSMAMINLAIRLRDDVIHATRDIPLGTRNGQAWLMMVTGPRGSARQSVSWRLRDGTVTRTSQPATGGRPVSEVVATGIDGLEILTRTHRGARIRITVGADTLELSIQPAGSDAS